MTREEHIIYTKNLRTALNMANNFSAETMESLDAAIKALEQEPCEDCISRAAAMTKMQMNARRYSLAKEFCGMGQVEWSDFLISIKDALNILRDLPSVQSKAGHWVSVRDSLPIFGVDVLICDLDGDVYISYLHTDGEWGYDKYGNKLKNIIAWQPLPKPYQGEVAQ